MRSSLSTSPALPDDRDVYLVLNDFGERLGRAWRETDEESGDGRRMQGRSRSAAPACPPLVGAAFLKPWRRPPVLGKKCGARGFSFDRPLTIGGRFPYCRSTFSESIGYSNRRMAWFCRNVIGSPARTLLAPFT